MKKEKNGGRFTLGMSRREFIKNSGLMLGAASLAGMPSQLLAQNVNKWKYYYFTPPLHHDTVTMREYAKEVQQLTNNDLQITVYPGGELPYRPPEAINIVRDRFVDGAGCVGDFVAGTVPILNLTNLPMLVTDVNEMSEAMKIFVPYVNKELEKRGVRLLFWHFNSQKCIFGRGKPVEGLGDLKGMKIRTFGVPDSQFLRKLGATPVSMPNTEVPTAMQRGVMDAFIASAFFSVGSRWAELCDWAYLVDMTAIAVYEVVSVASVKKLSQSNAKVLFDTAQKYHARWNKEIVALEAKSRKAMASKGKKMIPITPQDRSKAIEIIKPYWQEWANAAGPDAVEALKKVRNTLNK